MCPEVKSEFGGNRADFSTQLRAAQARARLMELRKQTGKQLLKGEGPIEWKKKMDKFKRIYQIINGGSALTVVGIIVSFLVMNLQLIFGNLLKIKIVPPLGMIEKILLAILDIFVLIILLFIIALGVAVSQTI